MRQKKTICFWIVMIIMMFSVKCLGADEISSYLNVEFSNTSSVSVGTVRYVSQVSGTKYFYSNYWGDLLPYAINQCQVACISMALSYVGVDKLPSTMSYGTGPAQNFGSVEFTHPSSVSEAVDIMESHGGKYSPCIVHMKPSWTSGGEHWVIVAGRKSGNTYYVLDPGSGDGLYETTIEGNTYYYGGGQYPIDFRVQYYNPNAQPIIVYSSKPSDVSIALEKTDFQSNEHVTYYCTGKDVQYYVISIYNSDGSVNETVRISPGTYCTRYYSPGSYSVYCEAYNNCGNTFSNTVQFTVSAAQKPKNVQLSLEKTEFESDEHVTYYCNGDNVSYYIISIYNSDGSVNETVRVNPGEYCTRYYNPGNYTAYCEGYNDAGNTFSNTVTFTVSEPNQQTNVLLALEKYMFFSDEHVTYYCSGSNVSYYIISIYNSDGSVNETVRVNPGEYCTRYYNPGDYIAYCEGFNDSGSFFSNTVRFTVKAPSKPSNVTLSIGKEKFLTNETVIYTCQGEDVSYYVISIYDDKGNVLETVQLNPGQYCTRQYGKGKFIAYCEAFNKYGETFSNTVEFVVVDEYTLTYHLDGGINSNDNPVTFISTDLLEIKDPQKEHYDFKGWYLSETGNEKFQNGQMYDHDLDLYARWEKTGYDITLYVNHEVDPNTELEGWVRKVTYGDPFGDLPVPEWEGYTFIGWFTEEEGGTQITAESVYTDGTAFYAHWEQKPVHVTFDGNKVFTEPLDDYAKEILPGKVYGTLPEISALGYDFQGWFTDPVDGSEVTADTAVPIIGDHTLYAHWLAKEFILSFDANMEGVENPASRKVRYKEPLGELPVCSSDDYDFLGWFDAVDGTRKFTSTSVYNEANDLTLFAKWKKKEIPHEHSYDSAVTKEPNCTEPGIRTYTCAECGDAYTEEIPATGHTAAEEKSGVKASTCTEDGYSGDVVCKDCGAVLEKGQRIEATGHKHTTVLNAKAASCNEDGYTGDTYCLDCEALITPGSVIKAAGHQWVAGDITKEVTCTEAGEQEYTCSVCEETKIEKIPCNGHLGPVVIKLVKGATCTQDGYTGVTVCTKCSEIIKEGERIPATGHQHTVVINSKEATCSEEGYTGDTYCTDCESLVQEGSVIPQTAHAHTEIRNAKEATCKEGGYTGDTYCTDCGELISSGETLPQKEHVWDQGSITKASTATEDGIKTYTCTICGETKEEKISATGETKPTETLTPEKPEESKPEPQTPPQSVETDPFGNTLVSEQQMENAVLAMPDDNDPANSTFSLLQARAKKVTKNSITIAWKGVPGATSYTVFGNRCGKGNRYEKLVTVSGGQYVHKNLNKGTYYKFLVVANGGGKARAISKTIHAATSGGKVGNDKSVKITSKKTVTLKKGKTSKIKAKTVAKSSKLKVKKHRKLAFETSNPKVATVDKSGKIKAVGIGNCIIYVYAQDGVFAKVSVKVK